MATKKHYQIRRVETDDHNISMSDRIYYNPENKDAEGGYSSFAEFAKSKGYTHIAVVDDIEQTNYEVEL